MLRPTGGRPTVGEGSYGPIDRWRALITKTHLLVVVSITAAVGLVMYLGVQARQESEPAPPAALAACDDGLRAMKSASERTLPAAQAGSSLANASVSLDHASVEHPRLDTLVLAMRHTKNEVEAGQLNGYWGKALVKECQRLT